LGRCGPDSLSALSAARDGALDGARADDPRREAQRRRPLRPRWCTPYRCRANMAHIRQSRPDYGLHFQVKVPKSFKVFPLRSEAVGEVADLRTPSHSLSWSAAASTGMPSRVLTPKPETLDLPPWYLCSERSRPKVLSNCRFMRCLCAEQLLIGTTKLNGLICEGHCVAVWEIWAQPRMIPFTPSSQ